MHIMRGSTFHLLCGASILGLLNRSDNVVNASSSEFYGPRRGPGWLESESLDFPSKSSTSEAFGVSESEGALGSEGKPAEPVKLEAEPKTGKRIADTEGVSSDSQGARRAFPSSSSSSSLEPDVPDSMSEFSRAFNSDALESQEAYGPYQQHQLFDLMIEDEGEEEVDDEFGPEGLVDKRGTAVGKSRVPEEQSPNDLGSERPPKQQRKCQGALDSELGFSLVVISDSDSEAPCGLPGSSSSSSDCEANGLAFENGYNVEGEESSGSESRFGSESEFFDCFTSTFESFCNLTTDTFDPITFCTTDWEACNCTTTSSISILPTEVNGTTTTTTTDQVLPTTVGTTSTTTPVFNCTGGITETVTVLPAPACYTIVICGPQLPAGTAGPSVEEYIANMAKNAGSHLGYYAQGAPSLPGSASPSPVLPGPSGGSSGQWAGVEIPVFNQFYAQGQSAGSGQASNAFIEFPPQGDSAADAIYDLEERRGAGPAFASLDDQNVDDNTDNNGENNANNNNADNDSNALNEKLLEGEESDDGEYNADDDKLLVKAAESSSPPGTRPIDRQVLAGLLAATCALVLFAC